MIMPLDFSKIETEQCLQPGEYGAVVVDAVFKTSSSGNEYINIKWRITDREHYGRIVYAMLVFTEKCAFRIKNLWECIFPDEVLTTLDPAEVTRSGRLIGKKALLKLKISEFNGEDRNEVVVYKPFVSKQPVPVKNTEIFDDEIPF
jgi:hypothetical protein